MRRLIVVKPPDNDQLPFTITSLQTNFIFCPRTVYQFTLFELMRLKLQKQRWGGGENSAHPGGRTCE